MLSARERKFNTFAEFRDMSRGRHLDIAAPDKDEDHPMVREIRKRLLEMVQDLEEGGFMDKK